ncbi:class I SAM-dependent methyltransferase [Galactobacter caseinivorans]|uniref:class I SAM-dependent methyltransferase n=1 Tax=Galactobacter caseinivorans TaxID=2676123 RepID=UPI001F2D46DA|nr:methyltransferase [Galactobacter caseinivorans]
MSTPLDLDLLSRRPDVEDPTLQAHDATDELLVREGLVAARERGLTGADVVVVGERHGAITLSLLAQGLHGMRVIQDRLVHERALDANAAEVQLDPAGYRHLPAHPDSFAGARLILWQLPRSVAAVERGARMAAHAAPDALLIAGGRIKHLSVGMNAPLAQHFGQVQPQRAERKSRLLLAQHSAVAGPGAQGNPAASGMPAPVHSTVNAGGRRLKLAALAEAFGGADLDPGTALMLRTLDQSDWQLPPGEAALATPLVVDLGCGNGTIACWAALTWPQAHIEATDDSADAVASAELSAALNGVQDRVSVVRADGGDHLPDGAAELVLLNPPFHQGGTVHTGIASKLIRSAARMLRPGGTLVCVWNSHLRYRPRLERLVGPTQQLARDKTFTLTVSTRRG